MYNKLNLAQRNFLNSWYHMAFLIMLYIITFYITKNYISPYIFSKYDESQYIKLEEEATNIAKTHDFDSDYEYELKYNKSLKELSVDLYSKDSSAKVYLIINEYNTPNESYSIKRSIPNKDVANTLNLIYIDIFSFIPPFLIDLLFILISSLILLFAFIYDKFHIQNKQIE